MDENNNPIKDYGTSRISKLFGDEDLSGGYESKYRSPDPTIAIIMIFVIIMISFSAMIIYIMISSIDEPKEESSSSLYYEEASVQDYANIQENYDDVKFHKLTSISFDNGITIPTLYKYSQKDDINSNEYNYSDRRFGQNVSTVEIIYFSEITTSEIEEYIQALKRRNYKLIETNDVGENIYAYNDNTKGAFAFVIIGNTRVVYGVGTGRYSRIFN